MLEDVPGGVLPAGETLLDDDIEALRARLREAEETLAAIRTGQADALVVQTPDGPRTYTLVTADQTYRLLVEQMSEGALTIGRDGLILYCNARLTKLLGATRATLAGVRLHDIAHPDDREQIEALLLRAERGGEVRGELRLRTTEGSEIPVALALSAFHSSGFDGLCAIVSDIRERKRRAERERLLEAEHRARERLMDVLSVADALAPALSPDEVGRTIVAIVRRTLQADVAALMLLTSDGREVEVLSVDTDDGVKTGARVRLDVPSAVARAIATRAVVACGSRSGSREPIGLPADDEVQATITVPLLMGDRVLGVLLVASHVPRHWADDEVVLLDAFADHCTQALERARLYASEQRARSEAESSNKAKSDFLAVMSHELRTPLNAIGGHLELIEIGVYGSLTDAQREALDRVQRNQRHLLTLINQILDFARIEAGRIEFALSSVAIADAIEGLGPLIGPQFALKGLTFDVQVPTPSPVVSADADKLEQILVNLLTNAAKFTHAGGRVVVSTTTRPGVADTVFLRVSDTGRGIPPEKLATIFEPFVRVRTGLTAPAEGVGLGLAIARDLARGMGGDLRARSVVGEGSTFTLSLPIAAATRADARPVDSARREGSESRRRVDPEGQPAVGP